MARKSSSSKSSSKSTRSPQGQGSRAAGGRRSQSASSQNNDSGEGSETSFAKTREFISANASMQTAGIALAGAGLLALVSTEAGRSLLRTASDAVVSLISQNSDAVAETPAKSGKGRSNRDQARI